MQRTLTPDITEASANNETESSFCLICDSSISVTAALNIFYTSLSKNGELLANFVLKVLRPTAPDLRSSYICLQCYDLFKKLEHAEQTVLTLRSEILKIYRTKHCGIADETTNPPVEEEFDAVDEFKLLMENNTKNIIRNHDNSIDNQTNVIPDCNVLNAVITNSVVSSIKNENNDSDNRAAVQLDNDHRSSNDNFVEEENITEEFERKNIVENFTGNGGNIVVDVTNVISNNSSSSYVIETENAEKLTISSGENFEELEKSDTPDKGTWKSGRISKYSQKPLKYSCTSCDKKWRTLTELKTHVKSHSSLRPYMCEKCGQAYKHKNALEIHVGMHNGVSPFKCNVCNKCFTQKGALMRHLPMHTGETPYQCELCGKRFVHHTSYNMHALSHTGKKSYQCHVCDLSLLSTSHLKRHMRVHTGEKPYSCSLCGKSFAERYNLFVHHKIHDPVEIMARAAKKLTFKCERCDEHFDKKQKLDEHNREHDNELISDPLAEQTWQDIDYTKFANAQLESSTSQCDDGISEITQESITRLMPEGNL